MNEVKVETKLRLLCSSQIVHSAESHGELCNLLEKEENCFSSVRKLMKLGLILPIVLSAVSPNCV